MWQAVRFLSGGLLALAAVLIQVPPDQAQSNLSKWLSTITDHVPPILQTSTANRVAFFVFVLGALIVLVGPWMYRNWRGTEKPKVNIKSPKSYRIPFVDFCNLARSQGWDLDGKYNLEVLDFVQGLRQAAVDGHVTFWGKANRHEANQLTQKEPLVLVPPDHFRLFEIMPDIAIRSDDNLKAQTYDPGDTSNGAKLKRFVDLHIDSQAARAWLSTEAPQWKGRRDAERA